GDLDAEDADRIVETAEGNPLFLEQLVATRAERGEGELPPSVQAVLAARIAALEPSERTVLERAAVEGRSFTWGSVASLLPEDERESLGRHVMALVRQRLIQPDPSSLAGDDAFRFSHVLIREAAYAELPKELCAELHERLAERSSEDEIVGHHLEQAYRCRAQVGLAGDHERALAQEARTHLEAAAHKALLHGDPDSAAGLLERATSLLPLDDPSRPSLLPALGAALFEAGRLVDAERVLSEAIESSQDEVHRARARVEQQFVRLQTEPGAIQEAQRVVGDALSVFARRGDDSGQSRAWCLQASIAWIAGRVAQADEAWRRGAQCARRAGENRELFEILDWRASAAVVGPTPVDQAIELCLEIREQVRSSPVAFAETLHPLAALYAMRGEFDEARALVAEGNAIVGELGRMYSEAISQHEALVEMLAGNPEGAEERLRRAYDRLEEMGEKAMLAVTAAMLAQAIYAQDRPEEAARYSRASREAAAGEDLAALIVGKAADAKILARQGRAEEAEALAREAVELAWRTDFLRDRGDADLDLAEVLQLNGKPQESAEALAAGLEQYEEKGDLVSAGRARSRLEQFGPGMRHDASGGG
ncbi:MAG TPA: tetratricopeptide repeat protein, partial [Gaiellaceae bacterium]